MRGSLVLRCQVMPPSSDRKNPLLRIAYTRFAFVFGAIANPIVPRGVALGRPTPATCRHVSPSSVDLKINDSDPRARRFAGSICRLYVAAKIVRGSSGAASSATTLVLSSQKKTCFQFLPPSVVLEI